MKEAALFLMILLCFIGSVFNVADASVAQYFLVIFAGQSNMMGRGQTVELNSKLWPVPDNVEYYDFGKREERITDFGSLAKFGPEFLILRKIGVLHPDQTILGIKYAVGGTSLYAWSPDWTVELASITGNEEKGYLYENLLNYISEVTDGKDVEVGAIFWMQGETDARFRISAENYKENLTYLITCLRRDLNAPDVPFFLGKVSPSETKYPYVDQVRWAQARVTKERVANGTISTDDLTKLDLVHFDTEGQKKLGTRFFLKYKRYWERLNQ